MEERCKNITAFVLTLAGFLLIVLNAVDYLWGYNRVSPTSTLLGLILVVIGTYLKKAECKKKVAKAKKKKKR
jgi:hypothetical protein